MRKKILAMVCMVAVFASNLCIPAMAKNSSDTVFDFNFNYLFGTCVTEGRKKEDASSSYIKAVELPDGGMEVRINGTHVLYQPTWYNMTKGTAWLSVTNQGRLIKQYVYEKGYAYAQLEGRKPNQTQDASGLWSPDSAGSYTYLN